MLWLGPMSDAPLSPEELEAIQDAMRQSRSAPERTPAFTDDEVTPLALIADDRHAETARPGGLLLGEKWARVAHKRLRHQLSGDYKITAVDAEIVDAEPSRDELSTMWLSSATPADGRGSALIAIGGPIIEMIAARLCGDEAGDADDGRPPSATALRIFDPIGAAFADALVAAWSEEQGCIIRANARPAAVERARKSLQEADALVAVALSVTGELRGQLRLFAPPATLVPPPAPIEAVPASQAEIEAALGRVPIEVRVDLGRTRVTMAELGRLAVGAVVTLSSFVDDPLPIRCGEVVKAYGRPVVSRGVLAVEIDHLASTSREKAA